MLCAHNHYGIAVHGCAMPVMTSLVHCVCLWTRSFSLPEALAVAVPSMLSQSLRQPCSKRSTNTLHTN